MARRRPSTSKFKIIMQQDSRGTVLDRVKNVRTYLRDGQPGSPLDMMRAGAGSAGQLVIVSSPTPQIDADVYQFVTITALAVDIASVTVSGTLQWNDGRPLEIAIKDNGTARTINWGPAFAAGSAALPTSTTPGQSLVARFTYTESTGKWACQAAISTPS